MIDVIRFLRAWAISFFLFFFLKIVRINWFYTFIYKCICMHIYICTYVNISFRRNLYFVTYISIIHTKISRAPLNTFRVICTRCIMSDITIIWLNERTKYTGVYVCVLCCEFIIFLLSHSQRELMTSDSSTLSSLRPYGN